MDSYSNTEAAGSGWLSMDDKPAFTRLLIAHREMLIAYIQRRVPRRLGGVIDADDVFQDACIEAFRHADRFEPRGDGAFARWLRAIALNRLRSIIRVRAAAKRGGGRTGQAVAVEDYAASTADAVAGRREADLTPSRSVARSEALNALYAAIAQLPEDCRRAVWLVHIEKCSAAEAGTLLNKSERSIHGLCRRGREQLRRTLGSASRFFSSGA